MSSDRTVVLTGAGSVIPWGAPSSMEITNAIISDRTFKTYTGQTLGNWFYQKLIGLYHRDPESVNFETIINTIEYLITFYSSKYHESISRYKNLMPAFFDEKEDIWELLWFDKIYTKASNGFWQAESNRFLQKYFWYDYDSFFKIVFKYFMNLIIGYIEEYSQTILEKTILNNSLVSFLQSIKKPLRCYTTNYDRLIPALYNKEMFEGFTKQGNDLKFDLRKVLTDETSDLYFNLHGSAYFDMDWPGNVKYSPNKCVYDFGSGASDQSDQDQRKIINSNIITGYNKSSRILANPFAQFYSRFYRDCIFADKIIIIGYSFGDFHINNAIRTASLANKDLKIVCVNYLVFREEESVIRINDWITLNGRGIRFLHDNFSSNIFSAITDNENIDRILIYRKGFEPFLTRKEWLNI